MMPNMAHACESIGCSMMPPPFARIVVRVGEASAVVAKFELVGLAGAAVPELSVALARRV